MRTRSEVETDLDAAHAERTRLEDRLDALRRELETIGAAEVNARREKKRARVAEILARFDGGQKPGMIARDMRLSPHVVNNILWRNKRWALGRVPPSQFPEHIQKAYRDLRRHGYRPAVARQMAFNLG